jgi:hypothetical protein
MTAIAWIALVLASAAPPGAQAEPVDDGAIAWACERDWAADGASASVVRYLTATGRLAEMYAEWQVNGSSDLVLSGFVGAEGREVSAADWGAHIGWSPKTYDPWGFLPQIVLGAPIEGRPPPNADRPERTVPDLDMNWSELRRHARGALLKASLVNREGRIYQNGAVDLRLAQKAIDAARKNIDATRVDARNFRTRCKPYTIPPAAPA